MMEKIKLLEAVERYLKDEMTPSEKEAFDQLRESSPEIDQLVVEHTIFLHQMDELGDHRNFRSNLNEVHAELLQKGDIQEKPSGAVVLQLFKKHRRVMAVAASIAGITTLLIAGMASYYSRRANTAELEQLSKKFENTEKTVNALKQQVESDRIEKAPTNTPIKSGGTGFLIDGKGYLATNAHVVQGANSVVIQNNKGQEYRAQTILINEINDIAILKIEDADFKTQGALPYGLKKIGAEIGETLFTLGFPREEIVYNEGYMSAKTGFNGDTLTCQIGVQANPGNSGGPVFNKSGEVIGIINTRQSTAEGVVFAITAKNIFSSVEQVNKDTTSANIKLSLHSSLKGLDRVQQIKKIEDCVFMVKSY